MLCYDAILTKTGIFKGMSQLFDIKSVHWSIIPLTAQALLSPSGCPAVNADLWWRNTVSEIFSETVLRHHRSAFTAGQPLQRLTVLNRKCYYMGEPDAGLEEYISQTQPKKTRPTC